MAVTLALLASPISCSSPAPDVMPEPTLPPPTGRLLTDLSAAGGVSGLEEIALPSGSVRDLDLPDGGAVIGAFLGTEPGTAFTLLRLGRRSRLFRLSSGSPPEPVGTFLGCVGAVGHAGRMVLATPCDRSEALRTLDLSAPDLWKELPFGAPAGLSPDGGSVAYSPDGRSIWTVPADGDGAPRKVLDIEAVSGLVGAGDGRAQIPPRFFPPVPTPTSIFNAEVPAATIQWGIGGVAFPVVGPDGPDIGVLPSSGEPRVLRLGSAVPREFRWQPGGSLLGFSTRDQGEAGLRLYDPARHERRVISLQPLRSFGTGFLGLAWSPDGEMVTARRVSGRFTGTGVWQFVDIHGRQRAAFNLGAAGLPFDWLPAP